MPAPIRRSPHARQPAPARPRADPCGYVTSTNVNTNQTQAGGASAAPPAPRIILLHQVPRVFAVAAGRRTELSAFLSLNPDCSLAAYYTVRLVVPPAHGTASVERGRYYPNYPPANPHAVCNANPQDGMALSYQSAPGYLGPDLLEVQAIVPNGHAQLIDYHLDVK